MLDDEHLDHTELPVMTWHTTTTPKSDLNRLIAHIRREGGTVASCQCCTGGLLVTWFTL